MFPDNQLIKYYIATYGEVVGGDCYLFKHWKSDFFDYIVDIGANVGAFVNYANMRHPDAKIFAYEPYEDAYNCLVYQYGFIGNIILKNECVGNGSLLALRDMGNVGQNQFLAESECGLINAQDDHSTTRVKSVSLSDIFTQNEISLDKKYFIKMDCEGGERFLLTDPQSIEIIKNSCGFSAEIHFPGGNRIGQYFKIFPAWSVYNAWMHDNFEQSHNIIYHKSRRASGCGIYVLQRK